MATRWRSPPESVAGRRASKMPDAEHLDDARSLMRDGPSAPPREAVAEVLPHIEMREEARILEDEAAAAPLGRQVDASRPVEEDAVTDRDHAVLRNEDARYGREQGGLAGTRGPEEGRDAGRRHLEARIEAEISAAEANIDTKPRLEAHARPCRRRKRAFSHSLAARPASARPMERAARRAALSSPPGACKAV